MKQPIYRNYNYYCPNDGEELFGDGENYLECGQCDYIIHESSLSDKQISDVMSRSKRI